MLLQGLSAFPITPSNAEGGVDIAALRMLVGRLCAAKVHSIGLLGSTGTYAYLCARGAPPRARCGAGGNQRPDAGRGQHRGVAHG